MDDNDVRQWFGEYLSAFAACGRGESDTASLLAYYGVPLFSRQRSDGSEISRLTASYLVTDGPMGRRISVLAVHSP